MTTHQHDDLQRHTTPCNNKKNGAHALNTYPFPGSELRRSQTGAADRMLHAITRGHRSKRRSLMLEQNAACPIIRRMRPIVKYSAGYVTHAEDELAVEEPLEIRVRGRAISVTMRTPGNDEELAVGFLLTEGVIARAEDVLGVERCDRDEAGNVVNVKLAPDVHVDWEKLSRHVFASSSCGVCGKATIESLRTTLQPIESNVVVDTEVIMKLPAIMRQHQETFARTGGLHAAALFDATGTLIVLREDVGRHNAVDKVVGHVTIAKKGADILLVSGRSSFEIMQKALAARVPIVAAVSAPSSLAAEFARENNQMLIGFLREGRMNIYSHPDRIRFA